MTIKELKKRLKKLGVDLTGEEDEAQLNELYSQAKDAPKGSSSDENEASDENVVFVWLKGRAYIDDKQRVNAGFYKLSELPVRLSKLPTTVVEVFENVVPSKKLAKIALWCKVSTDDRSDEEVLSIVLSEWKPF